MREIFRIFVCFVFLTICSLGDEAFKSALSSSKNTSPDILAFYQKLGDKPVWFFQGSLTKCGHVAVDILQNTAEEGLNAQDYEDAVQASTQPENWVDAEILLTKKFLEYIEHVRVGRIDPQRVSRDIKFQSHKVHPVELLTDILQKEPLDCGQLRDLAPSLPQYRSLRKILGHFRQMAKNTPEWPKIHASKPFKKGDDNPDVLILRQILTLHGDLEKTTPSTKFDEAVDKALRQFQTRHVLEADGVVGGKTKEALNQPIQDLILETIVNMERLRWLPDNLGEKYIIVNVGGYQVQAFENDEVKLTIPAIVGRPSRRTPLFYSNLKTIIVNPSWGVPYNILVHDKLPKILRDPDYVRRSGFTVTDSSGNIVDPYEADWENNGASYHLRQSPGRHNALGRIKFNIENPYTIYLHGTPEEKLFQKAARAFSSGCIRLKTPVELAVWALNDQHAWSYDHIQRSINKGGTQTVTPAHDIRVFFTYQTIWMGGDGLIHMSDDPYRLDPKMEKVMATSS